MLSMHVKEDFIQRSLKAGASGYILKDSPKEELIMAIKEVDKGGKYFASEVSQLMVSSYVVKAGDFTDKRRKNTGLDCSMVVATGALNKINITAIASEFGFLGASVASAEGEAFLAAAQHAIENKHPLVVFTARGGIREQEGKIR